nr:MAG TPA: Importin 13 repeat [Caudoviricetes sp.]
MAFKNYKKEVAEFLLSLFAYSGSKSTGRIRYSPDIVPNKFANQVTNNK